jgi:MHS family proline/betaine transporter-like MFS transporter
MAKTASGRRAAMAGMIGNVLEWYDFAVYGFFAAVIGKHYFPSDDPTVSVVAAFGVFAIGFLARPIGAVILGHLGDLIGRRRVMMISILAMAVPTFLIGVMPTYDTLGVMAPVVLILLRLVQGASVGGELTSSVTFMIESAEPGRGRTLAGSWSFSGAIGGVLLGSLVGTLITAALSPEQVESWGWRLPFLAGVVIAIAGFFLRRDLADKEDEQNYAKGLGELPLLRAIREHRGDFLRAIGITAFDAAGFYILFVYITTYLSEITHVDGHEAFEINTISMVVLVILIPLSAWVGDRMGPQRMCVMSSGAGIVLTIPLFMLMDHGDPSLSLVGELCFAVILAPFIAGFGTRMALMFPREIRMSAFSVSYNIGLAVFGGTAPMLASYLIERDAGNLSPAYLLTASAVISFVSLVSARRSPS